MLNTETLAGEETRTQHREGPVARAIERRTAKLPSDTFLWAAGGSIAGSLALYALGRRHTSLFVGQWAPVFLILGLYNKLVKVAGSDHEESEKESEMASPILND